MEQQNPILLPNHCIENHKRGSTIWLRENTKLPLVNLSIVLPGGYTDDEDSWGRADIAASMMLKSNKKYNMIEQSTELRAQGARVDIEVYEQHTAIQVIVHKDTLSSTLSLISDMIFSPLYETEEWNSLIEYQEHGNRTKPRRYILSFVFHSKHDFIPKRSSSSSSCIRKRIFYTKNHNSRDKRMAHQRLNPNHVGFLAVGDIDSDSLTNLIEQTFQQWPQTTWEPPRTLGMGAIKPAYS